MIGLTTALVLAGCPMALAADTPTTGTIGDNGALTQTDFKIRTDARIE